MSRQLAKLGPHARGPTPNIAVQCAAGTFSNRRLPNRLPAFPIHPTLVLQAGDLMWFPEQKRQALEV